MPNLPGPDGPAGATPLPFRLRAVLAVPTGWPADVAPNQIITASHINAIRSSVYAWPGDVDGQNHTLRNVNLVNATGVLADPTTTAGDLIARGPVTIGRFGIGTDGQVLTVDLALPARLKWATPALAPVLSFNGRVGAVMPAAGDYTAAMITGALADPLTTKGDLIARGAVTGRMPVGVDGQVLRVDASQVFGLRWAGESVTSVFGRTGAIVAQAGDYTAAEIANAISLPCPSPDPAWITSLSWAKLIGVPATFTPAAHTHAAADIVSGVLATARLGTGVANATVYLRGDGTWAAAGTGGGGGVISVFGRAGDVIAQAGDYTAAMVGAIPANVLTSTGDLLVRNNVNQTVRLPIGANGQVLQTDLATSVGMKWTSISASVQTPWVTNVDAGGFDLFNVHRLGVALTVPNYAVDVVGDINYTGVLRSNGVPVVFGGSQTPWTQNINASGFSLNNAGTIGIGVAAPQAAPLMVATHTPGVAGSLAVQDLDATTAGNPVLLVTGLGSEGSRCWAIGNRGGATYGQDLYVWNDRSSALLFGTNSAERMRITNTGNVGVGTTSPGAPLTVNSPGAAYNSSFGQFQIGDSASPNRMIRMGYDPAIEAGWIQSTKAGVAFQPLLLQPNGGNVGIGTANPQFDLHVVRLGSPVQMKLETNAGGDCGYIIKDASREYKLGINIGAGGPGRFQLWNSTMGRTMFSCTDTNVGIMTSSPAYALDVAGDVNCSGVYRRNGIDIGQVTAQAVVTGSKGINTVYQHAGRTMFMSVTASVGSSSYMQLLIGNTNPPTPIAHAVTNAVGGGTTATFTVSGWVFYGQFYQVVSPSATVSAWIEWS